MPNVTIRLVNFHCDLRSQQHLNCDHGHKGPARWRVSCSTCCVSHLYDRESQAIQAREHHLQLVGHQQNTQWAAEAQSLDPTVTAYEDAMSRKTGVPVAQLRQEQQEAEETDTHMPSTTRPDCGGDCDAILAAMKQALAVPAGPQLVAQVLDRRNDDEVDLG